MVKTLPGRNDHCPCGSGKKYKHCCARSAERPVDAPYVPQIDPKLRDLERREAEFWRPIDGGRVACDLCYRRCELADGEAGWCKYRGNEGGRMVIPQHGTLASMVKQQRGYQVDPFLFFKPGARSIFVGLTHCTAGCKFCMSKEVTWRPEAVPWASGQAGQLRIVGKRAIMEERTVLGGADVLLPNDSWWYGHRGRYTPAQVIDNALRAGAQHVEFGINEPTMSVEFTLDVARLAKKNGLEVLIESNGFTTPEAIRTLAPYVAAVDLGIKGSADPAFYDRWMRSLGAVPHVLEAAKTWFNAGVHLLIGDVIAPPHMQTEEAAIEAQERLYGWIAEELSDLVPVLITPMLLPGPQRPDLPQRDFGGWLLAKGGDEEQADDYAARLAGARVIAGEAGLLYAHMKDDVGIKCHQCDALLLWFNSPPPCRPCTMAQQYCHRRQHIENVTQGGLCKNCGTWTPVVPMTPEERRRHEHWLSTTDGGESVRTRITLSE